MTACTFCGIVDGTEPAHSVYEDEQSLAFLDASPATPGHTLVVPTSHCETLTDMDATLVGSVFRTARRVAAALESTLEPGGMTIVQSNGAAAGQDIFHAHVHVVPRYEADDVTLRWATENVAGDDQRAVAAALRNEL